MGKEEKEGFQVERKFLENYSGEECIISGSPFAD